MLQSLLRLQSAKSSELSSASTTLALIAKIQMEEMEEYRIAQKMPIAIFQVQVLPQSIPPRQAPTSVIGPPYQAKPGATQAAALHQHHHHTQANTSTPKRLDQIRYIPILLWLPAPPLTLHQFRGPWPHIVSTKRPCPPLPIPKRRPQVSR